MANVFVDDAIMQGWADTVREKTGTTDNMKPDVLLQKTQEEWGSGEDLLKYVSTATFNNLNNFAKTEVVINMDFCKKAGSMFQQNIEKNTTVEKVILNIKEPLTTCNAMFYALPAYHDETLKTIVLNVDVSSCPSLGTMFRGLTALEKVEGTPLDATSATNFNDITSSCNKLKELRFKENTISANINVNSSVYLSDETIQSIIDGLMTVESTKTLTFHANVKLRLTEEQIATITSKNWTLA